MFGSRTRTCIGGVIRLLAISAGSCGRTRNRWPTFRVANQIWVLFTGRGFIGDAQQRRMQFVGPASLASSHK
jgi:hypothetical protein